MQNRILLAFALIMSMSCIRISFAEDASASQDPVIGEVCNSSDIHQWNTERKQPWKLTSLLPVPEGYLPSDWADTEPFLADVDDRLSTSGPQGSIISSSLQVWQESYISPAYIYARFERTVTTERRQVRCLSGSWQVVDGSTELIQIVDDSGWVRISDSLTYSNSLTSQSLTEIIDTKLANFNSQPGAATEPFDFFVKLSAN